jgi:hypothetical protein
MAIDITRDGEGLRQALSELLEHSFASSRVARSLLDADEGSQERMFGSLPQLTLSPGYYKRAEFLLWLEKQKEIGVVAAPWAHSEAVGLMAVKEARSIFERNHPPCGICSALQDSPFALSCCACGTEFQLRRTA